MRRTHVFFASLSVVLSSGKLFAETHFVKPGPTGAGTCRSWGDACELDTALDDADSGDEIWVQGGVYGPITLKDGVKMIGGFAGNETLASQSRPDHNVTVLDGGDVVTVVEGYQNPSSTLLRGFHIRNGRAGGYDSGGGVFLFNSDATFVQCVFENNNAGFFGAAVGIETWPPGLGVSPRFVNCVFRNNGEGEGIYVAPFFGGAVFAHDGEPEFTNCLFHDNRAGEGGVLGTVFAFPTFINCTMVRNHAMIGYGGAIFDQEGQVTLQNCILWGNTTTRGVGYADQIYSRGGGASLARYCDIQGGWPGLQNLDVDPQFINASGSDYRLQGTSPCRNAGDLNALPADFADLDWDGNTVEPIPKDLGLLPRVRLGGVDIGAFENFGGNVSSGGE